MTIPMIKACVKGYEDKLLDNQIQSIFTGYYTGYYLGSKHPKTPDKLIQELQKSRINIRRQVDTQEIMDAKVAQFQEREERLRRFLNARSEN